MTRQFETLADLLDHGFDSVIDVRSPAEFEEDHVPGAINLPVLDNEERAEVGTIYVQESPFRARKIGAAKVFRNASAHVAGPLADHDGAWRPLVYCWRGGQRSGSFSWMLQQIGWRAEVMAGGYQTFRRLVHRAAYETALPHRLILLDGYTGTAKTEILHRLAARAVQIVDLEGLANHRGSVLGERTGGQPSQKAFETGLMTVLAGLDATRPVVVEAESNKIGDRTIPPMVWAAMKSAARITITASIEARARYLATAYHDILSDSTRLRDRLGPLARVRGHEVVAGWSRLIDGGDKTALTRALIEQHYDPAYAKSRKATAAVPLGDVRMVALDDAAQDQAAETIAGMVTALDGGTLSTT